MSGYLDDLAKKITAKAGKSRGVTPDSIQPVLTVQYAIGEWNVWVMVKPPGEPDAIVTASSTSLQKAVQDVAREVGVL